MEKKITIGMKTLLSLIFIFALAVLVIKPLTVPGFFPIHDDTQVSRVFEMGEALKDGMVPVRWVQDLGYGYGYPIFNFYAPLSYYIGGIFTVAGFDALTSTKLVIALGLIMAASFMYLLGRELWGNTGGIVSSLLYLSAPYNAVNVYVRGNIAELWGYAFVPLFFYGLIKIYKNQNPYFIFFSALGFAGIILSHNLTAFITAIFIIPTILFLIFFSKNKKTLKYFAASIALGLLLSSFYFIPAVLEMKYTNISSQIGGSADFRNHFVCIGQLWESNWGYGGSVPGCLDGMSFRIGKLHLILSALFILTLFRKKIKDKFTILISFFFLLSVFFMLEVSKPVWEAISPMAFIQYPWRFLIFASFSLSLLGGGSYILVKRFLDKTKVGDYLYLTVIAALIIILYGKLFMPQTILPKLSSDYTDPQVLNSKISKISDEYLPKNFQKSNIKLEEKVKIIKGEGKLKNVSEKTNRIKAEVEANTSSSLYFRVAYFPAWKAFVDGEETKIVQKDNGLVINVPSGKKIVGLRYVETPIEKASNLATITGLVTLILGTIYVKRTYDKKNPST